jgi:hypothetical protein
MSKQYIVITKVGFLTSKKEGEVVETDKIICESKSQEESEKIIHGKSKK